MQIAVYPGSFDPMHIGHLAIIRSVLACGSFDRVYLIVSPQNPLKDASKAANARERFEAASAAMRRHPELDVKVDDMELKMPAPHYTIRTLDALKEREPDNDFTLIVGADNLAIIDRWKESERILKEYGLAVFPRQGYDSEEIMQKMKEQNPEYRISLVDAPLVNISSTEIREGFAEGRDMSEYII